MPAQGVSRCEDSPSQLAHMMATAHAYQQFYGWPTDVDRTTGHVVLTVSAAVSAIVAPAELSHDAQSLLSVRMLAGPVLILPGAHPDWVFLTGPGSPLSAATSADLGRLGVRLKAPGSVVPLPPSRVDDDVVRWSSGPKPTRQLPLWTAVIGTLRSVSALCRT